MLSVLPPTVLPMLLVLLLALLWAGRGLLTGDSLLRTFDGDIKRELRLLVGGWVGGFMAAEGRAAADGFAGGESSRVVEGPIESRDLRLEERPPSALVLLPGESSIARVLGLVLDLLPKTDTFPQLSAFAGASAAAAEEEGVPFPAFFAELCLVLGLVAAGRGGEALAWTSKNSSSSGMKPHHSILSWILAVLPGRRRVFSSSNHSVIVLQKGNKTRPSAQDEFNGMERGKMGRSLEGCIVCSSASKGRNEGSNHEMLLRYLSGFGMTTSSSEMISDPWSSSLAESFSLTYHVQRDVSRRRDELSHQTAAQQWSLLRIIHITQKSDGKCTHQNFEDVALADFEELKQLVPFGVHDHLLPGLWVHARRQHGDFLRTTRGVRPITTYHQAR